MRIVYVLTSLGVGGAERQALALADRMAQRGHVVAVLVLRPVVKDEWATALRVVHLDIRKSPVSAVIGVARAISFLRGFQPDILHSHSFHANMMARLLKIFTPSTRVIATVHNIYEGRWYRMLAYRLTDALACRTTAVSQAAADCFTQLKAVHPRKCIVLPNGIDVTEYSPDAYRRNRTREAMKAANDYIWLAAGRLVPAKDFPNLLRAFRIVCARFPATQLWIAGAPANTNAHLSTVSHSTSLNCLAAELQIMDKVHLLGLRRDILALLDAADAFVQSSAWEGMPLAVGEAMAMEKPVIATDAGGTREILGNTGVLVPTRDSHALATAMIDMMQCSDESRQALGETARTRIASLFSLNARADDWESLYRSIMDGYC